MGRPVVFRLQAGVPANPAETGPDVRNIRVFWETPSDATVYLVSREVEACRNCSSVLGCLLTSLSLPEIDPSVINLHNYVLIMIHLRYVLPWVGTTLGRCYPG